MIKKLMSSRLIRFLIVAFGNAIINFAILNYAFYGLHTGKLVASLIATACVVVLSFILNRSFVFADKREPLHKLFLFIVVTSSGILLLQNLLYALGLEVLQRYQVGMLHIVQTLTGSKPSTAFLEVNLSSAIASLLIMIWNYNGYRLFVFGSKS